VTEPRRKGLDDDGAEHGAWEAAHSGGLRRLEREGLIAKTGEYRPSRCGELEPVYALTPLGREFYTQAIRTKT